MWELLIDTRSDDTAEESFAGGAIFTLAPHALALFVRREKA